MSAFGKGKGGRRVRGRDRNRTLKLGVELFEERMLLSSTYTVANINDYGSGSLRQAIINANSDPGSTINFSITGTGTQVINVGSGTGSPTPTPTPTALPAITANNILVDGGSSVSISGSLLGSGSTFDGLTLQGTGETIQGLTIVGFSGAGVHVSSTRDVIQGNDLGTDGTAADNTLGNGEGILIDGVSGSANATIGGTTTAAANVIGFNTTGISITGASATGTTILGNEIGTNSAGGSLGNATGIAISASSNTIGGTATGAANTIGFNSGSGVSVTGGSGNLISGNLYVSSNGSATPIQSNDISVASTANNGLTPPTLGSVQLAGNKLTVPFTANVPTVTSVTLEVYLVDSSVSPAQREYLGTGTTTTTSGSSSISITVPPKVIIGDQIIATATVASDGTSAFSGSSTIATPFIVTTTQDESSGTPVSGSLRAAILAANSSDVANPYIVFFIPGHASPTSPFVINLSAPLPPIAKQGLTIDATTQPGYTNAPVVEINSAGFGGADGLVLASGSDGSSLKGLNLAGFNGSAIDIASNDNTIVKDVFRSNGHGITINGGSDNTIGATTTGAGNTIAGNAGIAIDVSSSSSTGNVFEGNLIYGNGGAIVLNNSNNSIGAPTISGVASVPYRTTIDYHFNGASGQSYTIDFYADSALGSPASLYLGSVFIPTLTSAQTEFTATLHFATALPAGTKVTATVTAVDGTSELATSQVLASPFLVTNTTDNVLGSEVGSLRLAILDANNTTPTPGSPIAIGFDFNNSTSTPLPGTSTFQIQPTTALPIIGVPVRINGNNTYHSQPATVEIEGANQLFDGILLGTGVDPSNNNAPTDSKGSQIEGLQIIGFGGSGIVVQNGGTTTVGGTTATAANTIAGNATAGIFLSLSTSNTVQENLFGVNGSGITLANGYDIQIVNSSKNTIGGSSTALGNTIGPYETSGVAVFSGTGNIIDHNTYTNTIASGTIPVPTTSTDITLGSGANDNQVAPVLVAASYAYFQGMNQTIISFGPIGLGSNGSIILPDPTQAITINVDVYQIDSSTGVRTFLTQIPIAIPAGTISATNPTYTPPDPFVLASGDLTGTSLVATATVATSQSVATNGTSPFSTSITVAGLFTVVTTQPNGAGSLNQVILNSDNNSNFDGTKNTIVFAIPTNDRNYDPATNTWTIKQYTSNGTSNTAFSLNPITAPVTINGFTQGGQGYAGVPLVEIDGGLTSVDGFVLGTGSLGSTIEGLTIVRFGQESSGSNAAIRIKTNSNTIVGNDIGIDPNNPKTAAGNNLGIVVQDASWNSIGVGSSVGGVGNVIGGNTVAGIEITSTLSSAGNVIQANNIGTEPGNPNLGNLGNGVGILLDGAGTKNNLIGGVIGTVERALTTTGNVIGFNTYGVSINGASSNLVQGNLIGTDTVGDRLGNGTGVSLADASKNSIGPGSVTIAGSVLGGSVGAGNIISANTGDGIDLINAASNTIQANSIGAVTLDNVTFFGNGGNGISLSGSSGVLIGEDPPAGPLKTPDLNVGNDVFGNSGDGIVINVTGPGADSTVGGNVISDNSLNGVHVMGDLTGDAGLPTIMDNFIGTSPDGTTVYDAAGNRIGNGKSGVLLEANAGSSDTSLTGQVAAVTDNLISGNGLSGVTVQRDQGINGVTSVVISGNIIGLDVTGQMADWSVSQGTAILPLGNVLDGILLDNVAGVIVGNTNLTSVPKAPSNVISGNLGRGIEIRGDTIASLQGAGNTIAGNFIGTDINGRLASNTITGGGNAAYTLGNLSDGVFLFKPIQTTIIGNLISNNRAAGIHAATQSLTNASGQPLMIQNNFIGTDVTGTSINQFGAPVTLGNGTDGIFLDQIKGATVSGNVVSGNRADGLDVLDSKAIAITNNKIGTDVSGTLSGLGNSSNGVFLNGSTAVSIGGLAASDGNVISGNFASGVFISGGGASADGDLVLGNLIGIGADGSTPIPNKNVGLVLSNTNDDRVVGNVISANLLDGILLANTAVGNLIKGNKIGTDRTGEYGLGNTADGVFLLGGPASGTGVKGLDQTSYQITGNTITGNVISGNNENGIQIFGAGSGRGAVRIGNQVMTFPGNTVMQNIIGLDASGEAIIPNGGNGVYLNNAGPGNSIGAGNVISGNNQSGVLISGTNGSGGSNVVVGNLIGTDRSGMRATYPSGGQSISFGNGANGIFIYGTANNTVGGVNSQIVHLGNLVSNNAQAGVAIFSPAQSALATGNVLIGNDIGTNVLGNSANGLDGQSLGNKSDGVDIFSGQGNVIGQVGMPNVISGNAANGIVIAQVSSIAPDGNTVAGNEIGVTADGSIPLGNGNDGVLVSSGMGNRIGGPTSGLVGATGVPMQASNVISANGGSGVELTGTAQSEFVQGNDIGVRVDGTGGLGNGFAGVFVNNLGSSPSKDLIGGSQAGEGNIIDGSRSALGGGQTVFGVDLLGPAVNGVPGGTVVQGNLIGLDRNGNPAGNSIGVAIQNSAQNMIGGMTGNVISGNTDAGVEITGLYSSGNDVQGNMIGTSIGGAGRPGAANPLEYSAPGSLQQYGVLINQPSPLVTAGTTNNVVQRNVISGNLTGVAIIGIGSSTGSSQGVPLGQDRIIGNKIGTDGSGLHANPNFQYGVYIENSAANTVGGPAGQGNLISANGVDGIEVFGGTPQLSTSTVRSGGAASARNFIVGNQIGVDANNAPAFTTGQGVAVQVPDGPVVTLGEQTYGVVVIGSSANVIGGRAPGVGNTIGGNIEAGVYITLADFQNNSYATPSNNTVSSNTIIDNGVYGVYRYESPRNHVALRPDRHANIFHGNKLNLSDYLRGVSNNTHLPTPRSRFHHRSLRRHHHHHVKIAHAHRPAHRAAHRHHHHHNHHHQVVHHLARPRIPALFEPGVKTRVISDVPAHHHHHHHRHH